MTGLGGGRGKQKLDAKQQNALDHLSQINLAYRTARLTIQARLKQQLEEELTRYLLAQDEAVYEAAELGIAKTRIAQDGLGVTGTNAVYAAILRHETLLGVNDVDLPDKPVEPYSWSKITPLPNGNKIAYLQVADDPHHTHTVEHGVTYDGDGYLFLYTTALGWWAYSNDMPSFEATTWAQDNPPS